MILCCGGIDALLFPFKFDFYTATTQQNDYGELERYWTKQGTHKCNMEHIEGEKLDPTINMTYEPYADLMSPTKLLAPARVLQEIFITNIVDRVGQQLWFEPHNGINTNTIFEVRSVVPVADPRGRLSYYVYKICRAQQQAVVTT